MTLYWWTHWFWITSILAATAHIYPANALSSAMDTTNTKESINSNNSNIKNSNSHITNTNLKETYKYPLDNVEDFEDVVNGGAEELEQFEFQNKTISNNYTNTTANGTITDIGNESVVMTIPSKPTNSKETELLLSKNSSSILSISSSTPQPDVELDSLGTLMIHNQSTASNPSDNINTLSEVELIKAPFTLENVNREDELIRAETEHRSRKSKVLSAEYRHESRILNNDSKNLLTRSAAEGLNVDDPEDGNVSSEALSVQRAYFLDAGSISGICFAAVGICCAGAFAGVFIYRRRYNNKPQALSEPDLSVYIDDSTIRDTSDEMYSLDNDSFLNSLEAMTIQNYWTDTVKHTKL